MMQDREKCAESGMDKFLAKPFSRNDVLQIVHGVFLKQQAGGTGWEWKSIDYGRGRES